MQAPMSVFVSNPDGLTVGYVHIENLTFSMTTPDLPAFASELSAEIQALRTDTQEKFQMNDAEKAVIRAEVAETAASQAALFGLITNQGVVITDLSLRLDEAIASGSTGADPAFLAEIKEALDGLQASAAAVLAANPVPAPAVPA